MVSFLFSGIPCRQLRISPHQPSAVCQTTPHRLRKCMLNKDTKTNIRTVTATKAVHNREQKRTSQGTPAAREQSCQTQHNRKTGTQEKLQSQNHHGNYHHCIRDCSFRNGRTGDIPINLPVKQKDSRLLCGSQLTLSSALRWLILNQEPCRQLFPP